MSRSIIAVLIYEYHRHKHLDFIEVHLVWTSFHLTPALRSLDMSQIISHFHWNIRIGGLLRVSAQPY
jgi:hypothetical protein